MDSFGSLVPALTADPATGVPYPTTPVDSAVGALAAKTGRRLLDGLYDWFTLPGRVAGTYDDGRDPPTPDEQADWAGGTALGMLGLSRLPGGISGSVGAAGSKLGQPSRLPMDLSSRMARAQEMGFHLDEPIFHGTDETFSQFQSEPTTGVGPATAPGVWSAFDPRLANQFAELRARQRGGAAQVYPLYYRADNPGSINLAENPTRLAVIEALRNAFDQGYDAVRLRNYITEWGPQEILTVRDANQLRSPFAAFDPAKKDSAKLLASGAGLLGAGSSLVPGSSDAPANFGSLAP